MLISPGIEVNITTETYTDTAGPGTVPLIVIATAANKLTPSGSGVAPYTTSANAGKMFSATSSRDLLGNFGNPLFWSSQGTPLHGYELNEYGLHAAWKTVSSQDRAYVLRADIDLAALAPSRSEPTAAPANGTFWFDYAASRFGVFASNGNSTPGAAWTKAAVLFPSAADLEVSFTPKASYGSNGQYAIVVSTIDNLLYEKIAGAWTKVGSAAWKAARPTVARGSLTPSTVTGQISVNGVTINAFSGSAVTAVAATINSATVPNIVATVVSNAVVLTNTAGGNIVLANVSGTALEVLGLPVGTVKGNSLVMTNNASFPAGSVSGDVWIKMTAPAEGTNVVVKRYNANSATWSSNTIISYAFDSTAADGVDAKDAAATAGFGGSLLNNTVYFAYDPATGARQLRIWTQANKWATLVYEAKSSAPTRPASTGTLWYSPDFNVDIMVNDGSNWRGYRSVYPNTDPKGAIVSGSAPATQSDGTPLVSGDVWLNSADLENYPALYRFDETTGRWAAINKTDQSTPFGMVSADARATSGPSFTGQINTSYTHNSVQAADMVLSDFVDPDAPDARRYPTGMLLFNTRYSTYNVKQWRSNYFIDGGFDPSTNYTFSTYRVGGSAFTFPATTAGRWVTVSGNKLDGSPYMGRKAQRVMVVRAMQAAISSNEEIRSEMNNFSLIVAPGYPELLDECAQLNRDKGEIATVITDVPARVAPREVEAWALNSKNAGENGEDGIVTGYEYAAAYYPWGMSQNTDGSNVMVPPSTLALRTILYSDQVGQVWFAPAGDERGIVLDATSVGYLSSEDEFVPVMLNTPQRNVIYSNKVNPIAAIPGLGLRVMGQKTLSTTAGPLDRVQGARLANHIRWHLSHIMRPFMFQQNDAQTRGSAQVTAERFFNGLMTLRAISDYAVLCDESNNTKERRTRKELWIDCAAQVISAAEFIYIPCRLREDSSSL